MLFNRTKTLLGALCLVGLSSQLLAADRPNIIYLMTDDQRYDAIGCNGNPIIQTPSLDSLASEGVSFDNAFVTTAICMTSRACVLTGQYAARHGIWSFGNNFEAEQVANTYIGRLHSAGYRTGFIGKWGVGNPKQADSILDYNRGFPGQSEYFEGDVKKKKGRHLTAKMGDQALEFLDGCDKNTPFHLSVSFKAPHCQDSKDILSDQFPSDKAFESLYSDITIPQPFTSAAQYHDRMPNFLKDSINRDRWAVRFRSPGRFQLSVKDYYRLITGVDVVVGRIREALREKGFEKNTIIIFTSDHGFFLGEFGFAGKWTPHEVSIRVPLIIYDPRVNGGGRRAEHMALGIDMAPTILELAGVDAPAGMQGRSLAEIVQGQSPDDWRESFFYEHWFTAGGRIAPSEGVRDLRWKYARYLEPDDIEGGKARWEELYDLDVDPHETTNLAADPSYETILEKQREAWKNWRKRVR